MLNTISFKRRTIGMLAVAVLGCALAGHAFAAALSGVPAARFYPCAQGSQGSAPGTYAYDNQTSGSNPSQVAVSMLTTGGSEPQVDVQCEADNRTVERLTGYIDYWFLIPGTPNGHYVPVSIHSRGTATHFGDGWAWASCHVGGTLIGAADGNGSNGWDVLYPNYPAPIGVPVEVKLDVSGGVFHTGGFQAVADPLIQIAPDFPDRDHYTIEFSANLVPEPSSAAVLLLAVSASLRALGRGTRSRGRGHRHSPFGVTVTSPLLTGPVP